MRYLQLITTAYKFAAIPKAAARFTCHNKNGTCKTAHDPSCDVVDEGIRALTPNPFGAWRGILPHPAIFYIVYYFIARMCYYGSCMFGLHMLYVYRPDSFRKEFPVS
jgi:hypothetical protein